LVFSSLVHRLNLWGLPLDTNLGRVSGPISQLTQNVAQDFHTSISADGRKVVFATTRSGNRDIWIKDLESGKETPLAVSPSSKIKPIISADGSRVVYWDSGVRDRLPRLVGRLYVIGTEEGPAEQVCDNCGWAWDWLPEKEGLIFSQIVEGRFTLDLLNLATKRITSFLQDPSYYLFNARFSQDGLWIAFKAGPPEADWSRVFIIPFRGEGAPKKSEWVAVTDDHGWNDNPHWSPDGELIYFTSNRDGFVCLWMQPVEPTNKQPRGSPRPLYHFHEARRSMTNVNIGGLTLSVARNKIVFPQGELTGNLWKAEPEGGP
jgi:Tol biopolymer transport system component